MTTTLDEAARAMAARVRATGRGFLSLRRDELRGAFGIGRLTQAQSDAIAEALGRQNIYTYPHPVTMCTTLRLYDQRDLLADVAQAIIETDAIPETALRRAAEIISRATAGHELRSSDVPWLTAFDLLLQLVLGHEHDDWEELRDDRHPSELARSVAVALGFEAELAARATTSRLARAVSVFRPKHLSWTAGELLGPGESEASVLVLIGHLMRCSETLETEHNQLLKHAARLLLQADDVPSFRVELGLLGLRYRREQQ
jgi:hypothetical protein